MAITPEQFQQLLKSDASASLAITVTAMAIFLKDKLGWTPEQQEEYLSRATDLVYESRKDSPEITERVKNNETLEKFADVFGLNPKDIL